MEDAFIGLIEGAAPETSPDNSHPL
jgi:hypothetical protein